MVATDWAMNSCLSRNSCFLWTLFLTRRESTGLQSLQYAGHWTSRKHSGNTSRTLVKQEEHSRLYLSLFFYQEKTPDAFCAPLWHHCMKMTPPTGRAHPHVYTVQVWSKSDQRFPEILTFLCHAPLLEFLLFWPLSAPDHPAPETWPQNQPQLHSNSSPSLPRPQQMPLLVCWPLGQHQSACLSMTGTLKMHTTPSPYFAIPWRTGSSSTTYCQTVRPPQVCFCSPRHQIPRNACTMDANWQQRGTESDQGKSFCLPQPYPAGNDTWCQYPCAPWRIGRDCGQARKGPPRSHRMYQDPDGPLQDDQWWASQAQTTLLYHLCILPWGKAPRKTYGQAIQDTLQWAGWDCCEPLCHPICQGTSLPQHQTCGNNLPGQRADSHTPAIAAMVTHHLHPPRTVPTAPNSTQLADQTAQHMIPIVPNVTKWDTGDPNAMVASHSNQGTHLHLGHSRGSPRCPPRNHNCCQGQNNKTDTIDVKEDHSPQDKIALHYIQTKMTVQNTHPEEIMVGDVCAPQCNEAYTTIQLPASASRKGTASLHVKVDTLAGGNALPLHVFRHLYPDQISPAGLPTGLDHVNTRLTAYNGSHIPLYGALRGPITWQPNHPGSWPHRVKSYWYIADTPGPTILGLPSSEKLAVVKMNCAINIRQPCTHPAPVSTTAATTKPATAPEAAKPIRSTDDLIKEFLDQFKGIGQFPGKYKIQLRHDAHPVIHAPRKCPIALRPKVKEHLDKMECLDVITHVDEPTDWVSSITYVQKANGKLRLCLDPRDLNEAICCDHHKTPTVEEVAHEFAHSCFFTKLDARHGYWSIILDQDSSLLTTFNSPFGRYCFLWLPFGLVCSQDIFQKKDGSDPWKKCQGCIGITDDITVHGHNEAEHDARLWDLMRIACKYDLVFNPQKTHVKAQAINFLWLSLQCQWSPPRPR